MSTSETTQKPRFVTLPWGRAQVVDEVTFLDVSASADGRATMLDVLAQDYVRTAKAKGVG